MANKELLKIGYIDEDQADIDRFYRCAKSDFDVKDFKPNRRTTIKMIIDWVRETGIAALIVDYNLKEKDSVKFYGNKIVEKLHEEFFDFPSFIITSFEQEAIDGTSESDLVFHKRIALGKGKESALFVKRIRNKICAHEKKMKTSLRRYSYLEGKKKELSSKEENELLELDTFIERAQGKKGHISKILKINRNYKKLSELVKKVEKLTLEIKKKQ